MKTTEARQHAKMIVRSSLDERIETLSKTEVFKDLEAEVIRFEECDSHPDFLIDESGSLISRERLYLDRSLCTDEEGNGDTELAHELLKLCSETVYFSQDDYSQGYFEWVMEQNHGDPCTINFPTPRNCYAVHCPDLDLRVNQIESEDHGLILIEIATRSHGYFPHVGRVDNLGYFFHLKMPEHIQDASDEDLKNMLDGIQSEKC